jgi:hypothetical protein
MSDRKPDVGDLVLALDGTLGMIDRISGQGCSVWWFAHTSGIMRAPFKAEYGLAQANIAWHVWRESLKRYVNG